MNITKFFKNDYFEEHLQTAASDCRLSSNEEQHLLAKLDEIGHDYALYLFVSFWYYYICILSRESRTEVFLKKVFLKKSQNSQENTCTGIPFLSASTVFSKAVDYFCKSSIIDVWLCYKYASVLPPDLKPIYKDFLLWKLLIKTATVLYYHKDSTNQTEYNTIKYNIATLVK